VEMLPKYGLDFFLGHSFPETSGRPAHVHILGGRGEGSTVFSVVRHSFENNFSETQNSNFAHKQTTKGFALTFLDDMKTFSGMSTEICNTEVSPALPPLYKIQQVSVYYILYTFIYL
jgi:hypothetical protein